MIARIRPDARKGSWRWAVQVAELTAWGTVLLVGAVLWLADLPPAEAPIGWGLTGGLAVWLVLFFRVLLFRHLDRRWLPWSAVLVHVGFACGFFALWRGEIPSAQLIFIPVIVATGLIGGLPQAMLAVVLASGSFYGVALASGTAPGALSVALTCGSFLLAGSVAGLLARELRTHYRGEQEEHRIATAVRLRLMAVLDAVDEAILFRDRNGIARVINRRAGELFGIDPNVYLGSPVVELWRSVARLTEDPEAFMESYQDQRDEPGREMRLNVEQLLPARRQLRLFSSPTFDDDGSLVGRIDVFTDISDAQRDAAEIKRLYEEARSLAETYQRALLPEAFPKIPRLSLVAHYLPASARRTVCGDFYDLVPLRDGRVALVLGDVCGTGPRAASDAAMSRYTLRSLAVESSEPSELLEKMNLHVMDQLGADRFVRLLVVVVDPERAQLTYVNAGHVPPVLYRAADRRVEWLAEGGLPLGIEETAYKPTRVDLEPGDQLVCYTDGLTEATRAARPFGQGKLGDLVYDFGIGTPGEVVQALRRALEAWVPDGETQDDVALMVAQVVPDSTLAEPTRELVCPNEPERVPEVRHFVGGYLADLRAPVEATNEVLLAVGEAVANAARHGRRAQGRSEIRVRCAYRSGEVEVTIADDGPGFDPQATAGELPDTYAAGGRGLYLMEVLTDEVVIEPTPEGTTVVLRKRLGR